ncbi:hypothetical protein CgunFtcFv8_014483 [Champsocephalus gunnari]|uniref:BEN domain-containing protein n=1 Tax=Champsocephalus gunnari TaxID=52237 RepID=A0AAN8IBB1_CHAGU|nr:hypothetical protein CgunFtcFv8_014483 [Champsocephalus gunnari]
MPIFRATVRGIAIQVLMSDTPKDHKRSRKPKRLFGDDDEEQDIIPSGDGDCEIPKKKKPTLAAQRRTEEEIITEEKQLAQGTRRPGESSSNDKTQIRELQSQVKTLQKENSRLRNMLVKEIPTLLGEMTKCLSNNPTKVSECEGETVTPCKPSEVTLGNDGETTVSAHCWETAKAQSTANGMARTLLMGIFSVDVLLKSNLTGGLNKVDPTAERRQALDGKKLEALLDAVKKRFPGIKTSDLRKSINTRICELRHQVKRKNKMDN